jgi:hypothetical protein
MLTMIQFIENTIKSPDKTRQKSLSTLIYKLFEHYFLLEHKTILLDYRNQL